MTNSKTSLSPATTHHVTHPHTPLSRRALNALMRGRHADRGGKTPKKRAMNLIPIATAYSRAELLSETGVGETTVAEIEQWLQLQGLFLRS